MTYHQYSIAIGEEKNCMVFVLLLQNFFEFVGFYYFLIHFLFWLLLWFKFLCEDSFHKFLFFFLRNLIADWNIPNQATNLIKNSKWWKKKSFALYESLHPFFLGWKGFQGMTDCSKSCNEQSHMFVDHRQQIQEKKYNSNLAKWNSGKQKTTGLGSRENPLRVYTLGSVVLMRKGSIPLLLPNILGSVSSFKRTQPRLGHRSEVATLNTGQHRQKRKEENKD